MSRFTQCHPRWATVPFATRAMKAVAGRSGEVSELLGGGFSNANFRSDAFLLRLYRGGLEVALREKHVLRLAQRYGLPVPDVERVDEFEGRGLMLQRFVEGKPWCEDCDYGELGRTLAAVHKVVFPSQGLFRSDGSVGELEAGFGWQLLRGFLQGRAGQRLEPGVRKALLGLDPPGPHPNPAVLVHSDFNPKNLLATPTGKVAAVLDWEFAMVNDPLIDFGNFFRFAGDHSQLNSERFVEGYREAGGLLPEDWRTRSLLHDLVSLVAFLDSPEELPETFATAGERISATLGLLK